MLLIEQHQDKVMFRLLTIGVPIQTIRPLIGEIVRWEKCSGVEWTIKRLKGLKVDLIRRRAGQPPISWVRKNRQGDVAGVIGSLYRWSDRGEKNFRRTVQALMAYTYYVMPSLTDSQKKKFLDAVSCDQPDGFTESFHKDFGKVVQSYTGKLSVKESPTPIVAYAGSPVKKAPRLNNQKSVAQNERILDDCQVFDTDWGLLLFARYQRIFDPLVKGLRRKLELHQWTEEKEGNPQFQLFGGEIHFLQEPGGKLRSVASPLRLHQEALRPLGHLLYDVVRSLPWDCTFDQSKAFPHVQAHLTRGGQVHSVDLSSATDYFPLSLQLTALKAIICRRDWDYVNLFEEVSRSRWHSSIGDLEWKRGQPLGLYPSFASFTLTHGFLLYYLNNCRHDNLFFVVGDDVVILSDELNKRYVAMLENMKCPWSSDKSISSNLLAEFGGKLITSEWVIPQMKWRKISDDNFLDVCRLLGPRSRCLLSVRQKRVFDKVAHLCAPIGLNFSLPGDNLVEMVKRTLEFYHPEEVVLESLMGLRGRVHRNVYSSDEVLNTDECLEILATFDEKVKRVLQQTLFSRWEISTTFIEGLSTLPQALELSPRLPTRDVQPSRVTALERYERLTG